MRTFHTGGTFTGELAPQVRAAVAGQFQMPKALRSRPYRTRHGEDALVMEANTEATIQMESGKTRSVSLPQGSIVFVVDGAILSK